MMNQTIWVNGRFLARPVSGVERVATETLREFARGIRESGGTWDIGGTHYELKLVAPAATDQSGVRLRAAAIGLDVAFCGRFTGHLWEQFELPFFVGRSWLINLCNTAPAVKKRQLVFIHDAGVWAIPRCYARSFGHWYRTLFRSLSWRGVGLVTNSAFSATELSRYLNIPASSLIVAPLGTDHMNRTAVPPGVLQRFSLSGEPFLLAVSSQNPNKNFALIHQALEQMGNVAPTCVVVGQARSDVFANSATPSSALHFCGYVSDDELKALIDRAICLIYPSFYEGFGLPPLEAMARGCPVICSNTSALPETCGDAALYCDPCDPASLARAIRAMVECPDQRDQIIEKGRSRASSYRWTNTAVIVRRAIENQILSAL